MPTSLCRGGRQCEESSFPHCNTHSSKDTQTVTHNKVSVVRGRRELETHQVFWVSFHEPVLCLLSLIQVSGLGAGLPAVLVRSEKNLAGRHQCDRHPDQTPHLAANVAAGLVGRGLCLAGRPVGRPVGGDLCAGAHQEGGDVIATVPEVCREM